MQLGARVSGQAGGHRHLWKVHIHASHPCGECQSRCQGREAGLPNCHPVEQVHRGSRRVATLLRDFWVTSPSDPLFLVPHEKNERSLSMEVRRSPSSRSTQQRELLASWHGFFRPRPPRPPAEQECKTRSTRCCSPTSCSAWSTAVRSSSTLQNTASTWCSSTSAPTAHARLLRACGRIRGLGGASGPIVPVRL